MNGTVRPYAACAPLVGVAPTAWRGVQVHQDSKEGKLWLMVRKHGKFGSDDCLFVVENFVRTNPEKVCGHGLGVECMVRRLCVLW